MVSWQWQKNQFSTRVNFTGEGYVRPIRRNSGTRMIQKKKDFCPPEIL
jgi:hypothetical protein